MSDLESLLSDVSFSDSDKESSAAEDDINFIQPFNPAKPPTMAEGAGIKCEVKSFDSVYNIKGERRLLRTGSTKKIEVEKHRRYHASALIVTKFWKYDKSYDRTELEIRSSHMKLALKTVVPYYKDFNLDTNHILLRNEPRCLFHFRQELQDYGASLQHTIAIKHILFLLRYMYQALSSELYTYFTFMENPNNPPSLDHLNLWMVFRPGDLIFVKDRFQRGRLSGQVFRLTSMERGRPELLVNPDLLWRLQGEIIDYDGTKFGYRNITFEIKPYEGFRALQDLGICPLQYHPQASKLRQDFVARGRKFTELHGRHYKHYNGVAGLLGGARDLTLLGEMDSFPTRKTMIKGRIIIDTEAFQEAKPSHTPRLSSVKRHFDPAIGEHLGMTEEEYLICHESVSGFSLTENRWGTFDVDLIDDIDFDEDAFDALMLEKDIKQQVLSLVSVHENENVGFDDVIKGKGKGMVFLLHGEAGVGKTLTAESISDYCRKPLLRIDSSSLGTTASSVEAGLATVLRFAEQWQAVALLDEADVFLEQRKSSDLERNSLVSVFLRILEYYQGILFLTTNRVAAFDQAFKSRIHLAISFPKLSFQSRYSLWATFISRVSAHNYLLLEADGSLNLLAEEELNGRQIKNIVRTAQALAVSEGATIQLRHINMALKSIKTFEKDFDNVVGEQRPSRAHLSFVENSDAAHKRRRL